jgi:hypothetical protein
MMKTESQTFLETSKVTFILDPSGAWGHILDTNEESNNTSSNVAQTSSI